jgi:hypothetical protein
MGGKDKRKSRDRHIGVAGNVAQVNISAWKKPAEPASKDRFCKEHPSEADRERFKRLLEAMSQGVLQEARDNLRLRRHCPCAPEAANAGPHPSFQRIEPIVPKEKRSFGRFRRRFCDIRFHGVISIGAPTPIRFEQTNWRLRHLQIPTTSATAPRRAGGG